MKKILLLSMVGAFLMVASVCWPGIPHLIHYQGMLTDDAGNPLNTPQDLTFRIYNVESGGSSLWGETQNNIQVTDGLFSVLLGIVKPIDLSFDEDYWLEIEVSVYDTLLPRMKLASVGYAYRAESADAADWSDTSDYSFQAGRTDSAEWSDTSDYTLKSLMADTANYAFFGPGVTDNDWLLRITDTADTTLMTGGAWGIARSGNTLYGNADSTHINLGVACTTGLSGLNIKYCTVGGGRDNTAGYDYATVGGGYENTTYRGHYATVGGGRGNAAITTCATITGGNGNTASGGFSTIGGGEDNIASGEYATIGGGRLNDATEYWSTVGGGQKNIASNKFATVGGGKWNTASSTGYDGCATVGGGGYNKAIGEYATVGGGYYNTASGYWATVPGGYADTAAGDYSLAAGRGVNISSSADYTFAFGRDFTTSTPNAVIFHNSVDPINIGIGTTSPAKKLHIGGGGQEPAQTAEGIYVNPDAASVAISAEDNTGVEGGIMAHNNGNVYIGAWSNDTLSFRTNNIDRGVIDTQGNFGIGTTNPQGALDVSSTTGAFIVPRMTTVQRDALTPVNGMIIYNTADNQFNFYENGIWVTRN
jgi:hypothetical protein